MEVYVVLSICDYEYGCRTIERIFSNEEDAYRWIDSTGEQREVTFWNGLKEMEFIVENWDVG